MIGGTPRILIIRLSAIGDVVRVLPALHTLREALPEAHIDWVVEKKSADILKGHPALDDLLVFARPKGLFNSAKSFLSLLNNVRNRRYDIVIDYHGIIKSGLIAKASGAIACYGFSPPRAQELSHLFTNRHTKLPEKILNRVEENMLLTGAAVGKNRPWPNVTVYVPDDAQDDVDAFYEETFEGAKRIVAVHAPVDRPEKQWPISHYAALCDMLLGDGRFDVILTWGPGQLGVAQEVLELCKRSPVIAPETADLKHYAWLAHEADLYVGGDTGPMHIAAAMGTPVVGLFTGTNPEQHAPYRGVSTIFTEDTAPKTQDESDDDESEGTSITPEMVYDACVKMTAPRQP